MCDGVGSVEPETIPSKFNILVQAKPSNLALRQPVVLVKSDASSPTPVIKKKWKKWTFE